MHPRPTAPTSGPSAPRMRVGIAMETLPCREPADCPLTVPAPGGRAVAPARGAGATFAKVVVSWRATETREKPGGAGAWNCDYHHGGRGPAARAGAAGARRAGPAPWRLRHLRGRGPGGAAGGVGPVAGRRGAGQPDGLADHGGLPPADRAAARGGGPPPPGGVRRRAGAAGPRTGGRRRHAHPAAAVLPPLAHPSLPGGADP